MPDLLNVAIVVDAEVEVFTLKVGLFAPDGLDNVLQVNVKFPRPPSSLATTRRVVVAPVLICGVEVIEEIDGDALGLEIAVVKKI